MADIGFGGTMDADHYYDDLPDIVVIESNPEQDIVRIGCGNTRPTKSIMQVTFVEFDRAEPATDAELGEWHPVLFPAPSVHP